MIFGHGIDLQEISAVKKAYDRNPRFAKKVLTPKEWERFESLSGNRQMSYLAGRWADPVRKHFQRLGVLVLEQSALRILKF